MRRIYHILSLIALIALFTMGGFTGFLFGTGRLNAERIDQIAMVLRGELTKPAAPATQPTTQPTAPAPSSRAEIERLAMQKEFMQLVNERAQRELEQRQALNQRIELDVIRQVEEAEARRREAQEARKPQQAAQPAASDEGFEKQLELFASLDPRKARELLMQRKDPDAVQVLMRLEPIRVKKIVDACKTETEMAWIGRILNQLHNMDTEAANGVDGPNASSR